MTKYVLIEKKFLREKTILLFITNSIHSQSINIYSVKKCWSRLARWYLIIIQYAVKDRGSDHTATHITTAGERTQALLSFYEPWLTAESGDGSGLEISLQTKGNPIQRGNFGGHKAKGP